MIGFSCQTGIHDNCGSSMCSCHCHQRVNMTQTAPATPKVIPLRPGVGTAYQEQLRSQAEKIEHFDFLSTLGSYRVWAGWDEDSAYYVRIQSPLGTFVGTSLADAVRQIKEQRMAGVLDLRSGGVWPTEDEFLPAGYNG